MKIKMVCQYWKENRDMLINTFNPYKYTNYPKIIRDNVKKTDKVFKKQKIKRRIYGT